MALLELKNIGKIYVSDNNVAVGIRGVNLKFERGEFVAITGKSGSGKSTLLNVISGMDTYEEGELYINGKPTSHFLQSDWENFRQEYISFIFQDYNIIDSFTVLQNVELALLYIDNPKERRQKAIELLTRVGLKEHLNHHGTELSGGQKQRTVIARALAKDSPIILADEPTGNLDSKTSKEIIALLKEVSKDKLVIVVTHNAEEVEGIATRHIRIYDGSVELDQKFNFNKVEDSKEQHLVKQHPIKNGLHLGFIRFSSMPKLSFFLCALLTLAALIITAVNSLSYSGLNIFDSSTMFNHINGRCVITRIDGAVASEEELKEVAKKLEASSYMQYDYLLDQNISFSMGSEYLSCSLGYPSSKLKIDLGRYPTKDNEVVLNLPLYFKQYFNSDNFENIVLEQLFNLVDYYVTGISFYKDNRIEPQIYFTENGYKIACALCYFSQKSALLTYTARSSYGSGANSDHYTRQIQSSDTFVNFDFEPGTFYLRDSQYELFKYEAKKNYPNETLQQVDVVLSGTFSDTYYDNDKDQLVHDYGMIKKIEMSFENYKELNEIDQELLDKYKEIKDYLGSVTSQFICVSPDIITDFIYNMYFSKAYTQSTLFFQNDRVAKSKINELKKLGYVGVVSNEKMTRDVFEVLSEKILYLGKVIGWVFGITFVALFIVLCTSKAMLATKGDIAIMRSMGIPSVVIKISIYIQMLLSVVPGFIIDVIVFTILLSIPKTNGSFTYLPFSNYLLIGLALIIISMFIAKRYCHKMFHESVKKTLKGGNK